MDRSRKFVVSAVAVAMLGVAPLRLSAAAEADRWRIAMMDDDKMSMKPGQPSSGNMNMAPSAGQPQTMGGGMNDDRMKMPGQMQGGGTAA